MLHRSGCPFFFFCLFSSLLAFLRFLFGQGLRVIFYSSTAVVGQNIAPRCCCSFPWAMERKNNAKLLLLVPLEREVLSASWALFLSCQSLLWQLVLPVVDKSCSSVRTCPFRALHIATYLALRSLFNILFSTFCAPLTLYVRLFHACCFVPLPFHCTFLLIWWGT